MARLGGPLNKDYFEKKGGDLGGDGGMDGKSEFMNQAQSAEDGATGIIRASMDKEARPGNFYGPVEGWKGFPELLPPEELLLAESNIQINWEGCEKAVAEFKF